MDATLRAKLFAGFTGVMLLLTVFGVISLTSLAASTRAAEDITSEDARRLNAELRSMTGAD